MYKRRVYQPKQQSVFINFNALLELLSRSGVKYTYEEGHPLMIGDKPVFMNIERDSISSSQLDDAICASKIAFPEASNMIILIDNKEYNIYQLLVLYVKACQSMDKYVSVYKLLSTLSRKIIVNSIQEKQGSKGNNYYVMNVNIDDDQVELTITASDFTAKIREYSFYEALLTQAKSESLRVYAKDKFKI